MRGTSPAARASARVRLSCSSFLRSRGGRRKSTGLRTSAFAGSGLGVWLSVRESTVRMGGVEVRSRGNPLMTLALAGAIAFRRLADREPDAQP